MNINLEKRSFLKKIIGSFFISCIFFNIKRTFVIQNLYTGNNELMKNFYFAKRKYRKETVDLIFTNLVKEKSFVKDIISNIEKRRKLSKFVNKKNIRFIT